MEVQVDVNILPETLGGLVMSGDRGFSNDDNTSIYLALTDGEYTVPVQMEGSFIRTTIPAAPENAFEYHYDQESRQYVYGLKSDLSGVQFPEYSFQLTGAVNEKGDWKTLGKVSPMVNVTWKVTPIHSVDSGEGNHPKQNDLEQDNLEQDLLPEQSMIIKQILETVPVEKENDDEDLKRKEDPEQSKAPAQSETPDKNGETEQSEDSKQKEDSNQNNNAEQQGL